MEESGKPVRIRDEVGLTGVVIYLGEYAQIEGGWGGPRRITVGKIPSFDIHLP